MAQATSQVTQFHDAVKRGDLAALRKLLAGNRALANARSETDARGVYPLHVAAEFGQADAARLLLEHGADPALLDAENDATALCWAAFHGRPAVAAALPDAGINLRNKHGLTPLGCAVGGTRGHWSRFSNASTEDWQKITEMLRARGGVELSARRHPRRCCASRRHDEGALPADLAAQAQARGALVRLFARRVAGGPRPRR